MTTSKDSAELEFWERYAAATPEDQRRVLYGRACCDLVAFIADNAADYDDVYALRDAAGDHFRALLEATAGLVVNVAGESQADG